MNVYINKSKASGKALAPPSKSAAHRMLICAALTDGCLVQNIAYSEDIRATLDCLESLGATVKRNENSVFLGNLDPFNAKTVSLCCRESGSTLRFMIPLCLLSESKKNLSGSEKLFSRPLSVYEDICREQGIEFVKGPGTLALSGKIKSGVYKIPGNISSQFITGLLFALPLLDGDSKLVIVGDFESESYIKMTCEALSLFGIDITGNGREYLIKGNSHYLAKSVTVEGDYSNAAFLDAFNCIGGDVNVLGLSENSLQGDRVYKRMFYEIKNGRTEFDLSDCPDLAPIMFSLAAVEGNVLFTGTRRLKIKESDRAEAMKQELAKFGVEAVVGENQVLIKGGKLKKPNAILDGHNDHRIVMALSLLCSITGGRIEGAQAVRKSFSDFFTVIKSLNVDVLEYETC